MNAPRLSRRGLMGSALALAGCISVVAAGASSGLAGAAVGPTGPAGPEGPPGEPPCVSRRVITIHWRVHQPAEVGRFTVTVNGETYKTLPASAREVTVKLDGTEGPEHVTVQIRTRTTTGVTLTNTRNYHVCEPRLPHNTPNLYLNP